MISEDKLALRDILAHLFHQYFCPLNGIPTGRSGENKHDVESNWFYGWLKENLPLMDGATYCAAADVPPSTWDEVVELVESGLAPERTRAAWYAITLHDRPVSQHAIESWTACVLIRFKDGRMRRLQVNAGLPDGPQPLSDGELASSIFDFTRKLAAIVADEGVDTLYTNAYNIGGEETLNTILGAIKHNIDQFRADLRKGMLGHLEVISGLFYPGDITEQQVVPAPRGGILEE